MKALKRALIVDQQHWGRNWVIQSTPSKYGAKYWERQNAKVFDEPLDSLAARLTDAERPIIDRITRRMLDSRVRPTVFLSYAKEDAVHAKAVYKTLKKAGFKPWRDKEEILAGEEWDPKIRQSIKESDFLLVCLSKKSIAKRGYIQKEMRMAMDIAKEFPMGEIFLIPVRFDECELPFDLARYQYVDWFSGDGPDQVIRSIAVGWGRRNVKSGS